MNPAIVTRRPPFFVAICSGEQVLQEVHVGDVDIAYNTLWEILRQSAPGTTGGWGAAPEWPHVIALVVRRKAGVVSESSPRAHLVPLCPGELHGTTMHTWCGQAVEFSDVERLDRTDPDYLDLACRECVHRAQAEGFAVHIPAQLRQMLEAHDAIVDDDGVDSSAPQWRLSGRIEELPPSSPPWTQPPTIEPAKLLDDINAGLRRLENARPGPPQRREWFQPHQEPV